MLFTFLKDLLTWFEKYAKASGWPDELANYGTLVIIPVLVATAVIRLLYKAFVWVMSQYWKRQLNKNISPFISASDVRKFTRYFVPTKFQNISPAEDDEPGRKYIASAKNKLIPLFLNKVLKPLGNEGKFYLLLADTGMGKTTFLINLFIRYKNKIYWDRIIAPRSPIRLVPLGNPAWPEIIKEIKDREETILLLDALDEDVEASVNYQQRIQELLRLTWQFQIVILTCRTQFFPSHEEEPHETGYLSWGDQQEYKFQKLYLSAFNNQDVMKYLLKRYKLYHPIQLVKFFKAWRIVKKSPSLMVRPMLLSHIDDLLKSKAAYEFSFQIYETLIQKWIERESRKSAVRLKYGNSQNYADKLLAFSRNLAYNLYVNREERHGYTISKDVRFEVNGYSLNDMEEDYADLTDHEKKSKSLLNRTANGYYKFSHKSILEYFIACYLFDQGVAINGISFTGIDATEKFYKEMLVQTFRSYDGTYETALNGVQPLSALHLEEVNRVTTIRLKDVQQVNKAFLQAFPRLSELVLFNPSCQWLYGLYSYFSSFKIPVFSSEEALKTLQSVNKQWSDTLAELKAALAPEFSYLHDHIDGVFGKLLSRTIVSAGEHEDHYTLVEEEVYNYSIRTSAELGSIKLSLANTSVIRKMIIQYKTELDSHLTLITDHGKQSLELYTNISMIDYGTLPIVNHFLQLASDLRKELTGVKVIY